MMPNVLNFSRLLRAGCLALLAFAAGLSAGSEADALVTAVSGRVLRAAPLQPQQPLQAFVRLRPGDRLALDADARVSLVFLASGREEQWSGAGQVAIEAGGGRGSGLAAPRVRQLPEVLVRQIARMPDPALQSRAGALRMRELPVPQAEPLADVEAEYRRLLAADPGDLNPELYWLASLFERGEFGRIEAELERLRASRPDDERVGRLDSLYRRAIANARQARPR